MGAGTAPALPQEGVWKPKYNGEGFLWISLEDNPNPIKSVSFPAAGARLCPAHQTPDWFPQPPDWFPQLGLLGAAVRKLCPVPRSRQSLELGKKATDPKDGSRTRGSGIAPQGHRLEGSQWDHSWAPKVTTEAKRLHGFCPCMSQQSHSWVETRMVRALPTLFCPCGVEGWGSSPMWDGTSQKAVPRADNPEFQIHRQPGADNPQTPNSRRMESRQPLSSKVGKN